MTRILNFARKGMDPATLRNLSINVLSFGDVRPVDLQRGGMKSYYAYLRYLLQMIIFQVPREEKGSFHMGTEEFLQTLRRKNDEELLRSDQDFILSFATKLGLITDFILCDGEIWEENCYFDDKLEMDVCRCYICNKLCYNHADSGEENINASECCSSAPPTTTEQNPKNWLCIRIIQPDEDELPNDAPYNKRIICSNCNDNCGHKTPYDYALSCGFMNTDSEALRENITSLALAARLRFSSSIWPYVSRFPVSDVEFEKA